MVMVTAGLQDRLLAYRAAVDCAAAYPEGVCVEDCYLGRCRLGCCQPKHKHWASCYVPGWLLGPGAALPRRAVEVGPAQSPLMHNLTPTEGPLLPRYYTDPMATPGMTCEQDTSCGALVYPGRHVRGVCQLGARRRLGLSC